MTNNHKEQITFVMSQNKNTTVIYVNKESENKLKKKEPTIVDDLFTTFFGAFILDN